MRGYVDRRLDRRIEAKLNVADERAMLLINTKLKVIANAHE